MTDIASAPIQPKRLIWQEAVVEAITVETPTIKTFRLRPPVWAGFRAGQHVDIRLTAPDGYQAERSYSIASAPEIEGTFDLTIEKLADGEVSPFFHDIVEIGDTIEMRGPIGGHFIWEAALGGPILLIGGGSGLVPLMSILRHRAVVAADVPVALIYSARHVQDLLWRDELVRLAVAQSEFRLFVTLTREVSPPDGMRTGRIDRALIDAALAALPGGVLPKLTYICGSTPFVETAATLALDAGLPFDSVRTERYGGMGS